MYIIICKCMYTGKATFCKKKDVRKNKPYFFLNLSFEACKRPQNLTFKKKIKPTSSVLNIFFLNQIVCMGVPKSKENDI